MRARVDAVTRQCALLPAAAIVASILLAGCVDEAAMLRERQRELAHPPARVQALVAELQPGVTAWYRSAERAGLAKGLPLNASARQLATAAGVADPARVRIVVGLSWPAPTNPHMLQQIKRAYGTLPALPLASTFGYAIYLSPKVAGNRVVLAHELTHVAQFERLGIEGFVHEYLLELTLLGHALAPLERAAIANQHLGK